MPESLLLSLQSATVTYRTSRTPDGITALNNAHWQLKRGEHWAILGRNGAGKSTLLKIIRGEVRADATQHIHTANLSTEEPSPLHPVVWHVTGSPETTPLMIRKHIATVSGELQDQYMRQAWRMNGEEILLSGFFDSPMLYQQPSEEQRAKALTIAHTLGVQHLLDMQLPAMSQGQLRKMLIARAFVGEPAIIVLDEVCEGLDVASRQQVLEMINRASALQGSILFATHRLDELPEAITHAMLLQHGTISMQGHAELIVPAINEAFTTEAAPVDSPPAMERDPLEYIRKNIPLIAIDEADVFIQRIPVLKQISWKIQQGENWVLSGGNGAGKSTLLRLLMGDERQAWGGSIAWFGNSSSSLHSIRQHIGYVSDKLQASYGFDKYHSTLLDISGEELVWTGFHGSVGLWDWNATTETQKNIAKEWISYLGLSTVSHQPIRAMSYGQLRRFMLCRAVVCGPSLLLLDEPCTGLDTVAREQFLQTLRLLLSTGMQAVYVTHYNEEIPPGFTHHLALENGRIAHAEKVSDA